MWLIGKSKAKKYFGAMAGLSYKFSAYSEIIGAITIFNPSSNKLKIIKEQLTDAAYAMDKLDAIANRVNLRINEVFNGLANIILWWNYRCAFSFQKWKQKYAHLAGQWFSAMGEVESLLCFSHFPNVCNTACLPDTTENHNSLEAKEIGHPLLFNEKRINNDFALHNSILIISGSNMSGKTTFLRTVGVNIVLARAGGFVCAKHMTCPMLSIMTSMRIVDDLNEGTSTFYAELKRISGIIDLAKRQPKTLFLIDEIFRGTNSVDRLMGAKTVIEKLNELGAVGMISTHDLELCKLADLHIRIKNYNFSEYYKDKTICFDYKLKTGMSATTNAKYLMEMVGLLD